MKHTSNQRRGRSRGNGRRQPSGKNRNYESSGPESKVRGSAQQILDKYLALARDAMLGGDRIAAEGYLQHAEHYYRIINHDTGDGKGPRTVNQGQQGQQGQQGGQAPQPHKFKDDGEAARETATVNPEPVKPAAKSEDIKPEPVKPAVKSETAKPEPVKPAVKAETAKPGPVKPAVKAETAKPVRKAVAKTAPKASLKEDAKPEPEAKSA